VACRQYVTEDEIDRPLADSSQLVELHTELKESEIEAGGGLEGANDSWFVEMRNGLSAWSRKLTESQDDGKAYWRFEW